MRKFRFYRFTLKVVVSILVIGSLVFFLQKNASNRAMVTSPLNKVLQPLSSVVSKPLAGIISFWHDLNHIDNIRDENLSYKEQLQDLSNAEEKIKALEDENLALKSSLSIEEDFSDHYMTTSQVISRSTVSWLSFVTVDTGKNDNISKKMLAVSNGALVGFISDVNQTSSTVQLLTSTSKDVAIAVKFPSKNGNIYGILSGYDSKKKQYIVTNLNTDDDTIEQGGKVLTSGLDGTSTANVSVGTIAEVKSEGNFTKTVYVSPAADFSDLTYVTILGN